MIQRIPTWKDPRVAVAALLFSYIVVGITFLGFNRSPVQIFSIVFTAVVLDLVLHRFLKRQWIFPFSALITGLSLSILVNYAHGMWLPLIPVFFAIASKYLFTVNGRLVYNPSLFGIVISLLVADNMISISPAYQWSGISSMAIVVVTAAILLFVLRIQRSALVISFLLFYTLALGLRAWLTQHHLPPETLIIGSLTAPAFYLFAFFMITDPASTPNSKKGQVLMALAIVLIDLYLHTKETLSTLFYAAFIVYSARYIWLLIDASRNKNKIITVDNFKGFFKNAATITLLGVSGLFIYKGVLGQTDEVKPGFYLTPIDATAAGISTHQGNVFEKVDPRLQHVAKWLLSVGDAVAVADFDNDGLQDIFLTYPLKAEKDRAALYKNLGDFRFQRVPLPALDDLVRMPEKYGLASSGLWFDQDNDGDQDLLIGVGYGIPILLENQLMQTGKADFVDVSTQNQINQFAVSLSTNVLDYDRDGWLDVYIGNAMNPLLPDYKKPTPFNLFDLPKPGFEGDRRMLNIMHRSWHNARNGGEDVLLRNNNGKLEKKSLQDLGISSTGWTLDIGTGDLNNDGWTDLYLANDFGPDAMYINQGGTHFTIVEGKFRGSLGRDTYKGMNASLADVDNNGTLDIYVSNVHVPLQAEGSMLWINDGQLDQKGSDAFVDSAANLNALNPRRFGWGGAVGDLDRDGNMDILQANGMVDNSYDRQHLNAKEALKSDCPDYWYWNARVALTGPDIHGYADTWADLRGRCIFPFEQNRVMLKRGKVFLDAASQVGWTKKDNARGIALADLDNDGDLDVLMTHQFSPVSLFRNDVAEASEAANNWLGIKLQGNGISCNRDAIGTRMSINYKNGEQAIKQMREMSASNGLSAQNDSRLLFGLGDYQGAVQVEINWCGKRKQILSLAPAQYHLIVESFDKQAVTSSKEMDDSE